MDKDFLTWFNNKLKVGRMPDIDKYYQLKDDGHEIIINVSDESNFNMFNLSVKNGMEYYWLPMNEFSRNYDIGLNSIYGALYILFESYKRNKKVYLFCHAGVNRSVTVYESFYYMMTNKHLNDTQLIVCKSMLELFPDTKQEDFIGMSKNKLIENIANGYLPAKRKMEKLLELCLKYFSEYINVGKSTPSLDLIKKEANI